jgi:tetratricopeptide (TPR) repeat protein
MLHREKTVRVFISSTFRDMHAERDHLISVAFPELRERLEDIGLEFYDVDLRWGVPQTSVDNERANSWAYCKQWIQRSEPFFVCLIGQRYGWVPPSDQIIDDEDSAFAGMSITEMEIHLALLSGRLRRRSYAYLRKTAVPRDAPPDIYRKYVDARAQRRLRELKGLLRQQAERRGPEAGRPVRDYECRWTGDGFTGLEGFGRLVLEDLWSGILRDPRYVPKKIWRGALGHAPDSDSVYSEEKDTVPRHIAEKIAEEVRPHPANPFEAEAAQAAAFGESRRQWFRGRREELWLLERFARSRRAPESYLCAVSSIPGQGKSALLAKLAERLGRSSALVVVHYVGATERSADLRSLIEQLMYELERGSVEWPEEEETGTDLASLKRRLAFRLSHYGGGRRVVLLLDALNQLDDGHDLDWLPPSAGPNVRMIVSCAENEAAPAGGSEAVVLNALRQRRPAPLWIKLGPLDEESIRAVVADYLREYCKELEREQVDAICAMEQAKSPLYLLAMLNELRTLGGDDMNLKVPGVIARMPAEYADSVRLFNWVLERLEAFGAEEVERWFAYLAAARAGMTSRELADLLSRARGEGARRVAPLIERGVRRYLMRRGPYLDFFHGQMREAVNRRYLSRDPARYHAEIADYMQTRWRARDAHALADLPFHLMGAQRHEELLGTLEDQTFLAAKFETVGPESIVEDFGRALGELTLEGEGLTPRLAKSLLRLMVERWLAAEGVGVIDLFHPLMMFKADRTFYTGLLEMGSSEESLAEFLPGAEDPTPLARVFARAQAALKRREGEHARAAELISDILKRPAGLTPKERGKLEYELAYIYFQTGRLAKAAKMFGRSALHSAQGGHVVGEWIGRCLEARVNFLRGASTPAQFRSVLEEARRNFQLAESAPGGDANATRWLYNVTGHLFEAAFEEGSTRAALACLQELLGNAWIRRYRGGTMLLPYHARMAMLEGDCDKAVSYFKEFFDKDPDAGGGRGDGLCREYYDMGRALARAGLDAEAEETWRAGLRTLDELGNKLWKKRIRQEMKRPTLRFKA